jgi:simple sugar transport system substrate-binding protein
VSFGVAVLALTAIAGCSGSDGKGATKGTSSASAAAAGSVSTGKGWCGGVKITYFQGGDPGDTFASILRHGAEQAATDTGANVAFISSGWDFGKMTEQFRQAIASKPDAISFMGHPGDPAVEPLARQAKDAGILVDYANVPPKKTIAEVGGGFVGANLAFQGKSLAEKAVTDFGLKAGDKAIVIDAFGVPGREDRGLGAVKALQAAGLEVVKVTAPGETSADPNTLTPAFVAAVKRQGDTKLVILPGGPTLGATPQYLAAANIKPGAIKVAGFDLVPSVIQAFKQGAVQLTADQQPFYQGYLPIVSLCMQKKYGLSPLTVDTSAGFVTEQNYKLVQDLVKAGVR